jgi:hypothetical protein
VDIALADENVVVLTNDSFAPGLGGVYRCLRTGCAAGPVELAGSQPSPGELAIAGGDVVWSSFADVTKPRSGGIARCPVSGCGGAPTMLMAGAGPWHLTLGSDRVFFTQVQQSGVSSCSLAGCETPTYLTTVAVPWDIVLAGDTLYFTNRWPYAPNYGRLRRCNKDDCATPEVLASELQLPAELAVENGIVYWAMPDAIWMCPVDDCAANVGVFASGLAVPRDVVVFDGHLYWVNQGAEAGAGSVARCPLADCDLGPETIADALDFPAAVAIDDSHVYVALFGSGTSTKALLRCAMP